MPRLKANKAPRYLTLDQLIDLIHITPHEGMSVEQMFQYYKQAAKLDKKADSYRAEVQALDLAFCASPTLNELFRRGVFSVDPYLEERNAMLSRVLRVA